MPLFFFHIVFELYPSPSSPHTIPTPQTNVFSSKLPAHSRRSTPSPTASQRVLRRLVYERAAPFTGSSALATQDWRFDRVSIQSIDMYSATGDSAASRRQLKHAVSSGGCQATKGAFVPGDTKTTEVGWGVVHLYRDGQETPGLCDGARYIATGDADNPCVQETFNEEDCTTLCILAVPSYLTPSDLLGFVGEQARDAVSHFRLVKTGRANKYMVLMKFREPKAAREWRKGWNGKLFDSSEAENCHVVFVKSIRFQAEGESRDPSSYPNITNDPFTPAVSSSAKANASSSLSSTTEPASLSSSLTTKPIPPPTPSLVELPTCPVCLERMDETTGLLTIVCQHVFHCACLQKWRGGGCPVCRHTQHDGLVGWTSGDGTSSEHECSVCGSSANAWICLICGNVGCGRYDSAHAFAHYEATSHSYAMDVVTQHVWDYAGDGYVHRLVQNQKDGKLVELPALSRALPEPGSTGYSADMVPREKLDNIGMEYTYLLTSQLDSQRAYFEDKVERAADKAAKATTAADEATRTMSALATQLACLQTEHADAQTTVRELERDSARHSARAATAHNLARNMARQFQDEQAMSGALMERIRNLETQVGDAEQRAAAAAADKDELIEQNRDLSFFISGQQKLQQMELDDGSGLQAGELEEGRIEVGAAAADHKSGAKDSTKKSKAKGKAKK